MKKSYPIKKKECSNCGMELLYKHERKANLCNFCIQQAIEQDVQHVTINEFEHTIKTTHLDNQTIICLLRAFIANNCHYDQINELIKQLKEED